MSDDTAVDIPSALRSIVGEATTTPLTVGCSGDRVTKVEGPDGMWVLKQGPDLGDEIDRLRWLDGRLGAPTVVGECHDDRGDHLLMSCVSGVTAIDPLAKMDTERSLSAVAVGLRALHELPIDDCPFDRSRARLLGLARARVEADLVGPDDLDPAHHRYSPREFLDQVESAVPDEPEDLVVVHGDYSLPNVFVDQGSFTGMVDVGRLGVGDRALDLALCARSVLRNYGPEAVPVVLDAYGPPTPSMRLLDFHVLVEQLL